MKSPRLFLLLLGIALMAWGVLGLATFIRRSQQVILLQGSLVEACESRDAVQMRARRETLNQYLSDVSVDATPYLPLGALIGGLLVINLPRKK